MALKVFSLDQKIELLEDIIVFLRKRGNRGDEQHAILIALVKDLRARRDFPRSNTLGALSREVRSVLDSGDDFDKRHGRLIHLGNMVLNRWPTISQALEQYGEESAE